MNVVGNIISVPDDHPITRYLFNQQTTNQPPRPQMKIYNKCCPLGSCRPLYLKNYSIGELRDLQLVDIHLTYSIDFMITLKKTNSPSELS
jgi:hypothetical protein